VFIDRAAFYRIARKRRRERRDRDTAAARYCAAKMRFSLTYRTKREALTKAAWRRVKLIGIKRMKLDKEF